MGKSNRKIHKKYTINFKVLDKKRLDKIVCLICFFKNFYSNFRPWATPPIISGYLVTGGHISGAIVQVITIILSVLIYLPFFRSIEKDILKEEQRLEGLNK